MGDHTSHWRHKENKSRRKRRRSSLNSSSKKRITIKNKRIQELEAEVEQLKRQSQSRVLSSRVNIRTGDELLIPLFDPAKDDAIVEDWTAQVDGLAEHFGWDGQALLRLIVNRLRGNAK